MEHKDDLSLLYNALINKGYSPKDLGDENIFRDKMSDSNNRKQLYDYVSARGDFKIGDYNSYEKRLCGVPKYLQRPEETEVNGNPVQDNANSVYQPTKEEVQQYTLSHTPLFHKDERSLLDKPLGHFNDEYERQRNRVDYINDANNKIEYIEGFVPALKQGSDALYQGLKSATGESANLVGGSHRDYIAAKEQLDELVSSGYDLSKFNAEKALKDYKDRLYKKELSSWEKLMEHRRKERESMSFFDSLIHKFKDPSRPYDPYDHSASAFANRKMGDEVQLSRAYSAIQDALEKSGGDVDKAYEILGNKQSKETWGDQVSKEAREAMRDYKPTKGFAAWAGEQVPQAIGSLAAFGAYFNPYTKWLTVPLGTANMGVLTTSQAGISMADARNYSEQTGQKVSEGDVLQAGGIDGSIELLTEMIPYSRYFSKIQNITKKAIGTTIAKSFFDNSATKREIGNLLQRANKELGGKLFSGKNVKEYLKDVGYEGMSEFLAESLQTLSPMIYQSPEDYPTLTEMLNNGWEGAKGGLFMGAFLGAGSRTTSHYANRERRKQQGKVILADTDNGVVEIVGEKDGAYTVIDPNGNVKDILKDEVKDVEPVSFGEFERGVTDKLKDDLEENENIDVSQMSPEDKLELDISKEMQNILDCSNQADGTVTECSRITTNEIGETVLVPGHIVGWMGRTVVENPDGTKSREGGQPIWQPIGSKERITLHEGEYDPESIKSMPTKDMMDATAEMMREEAQKKAEMESRYDLSRIDPPHADMDFIDKDGNKYHIVDKNPNGGWIAEAFSVDEKGNPTSQMVEITDEEYYDTMQAQLNAQEEAVNIQDESSNLSENQVENETLPLVGENIVIPNEVPDTLGEVNPAPEPTQEQKPALPVDEKGNILYHKMPVEDTIADLTDGTLDDNEIDGFIAANKAEAGKLLKKVSESAPKISTNKAKYLTDKKAWQEKVADAQARVDYWNSIGEEIVASRVQPGDKTAEAILSMGEPMNGEELAAMMLGTGRLPILYDSYKKETGGRNTEARGMVGLFATKAKGGLSIEEAGELLMLADQENGTHFFDENDPNAGRNTIIDVLSGARTRGDLFGFIQRNREVMAERERQAELEAYEQTIARLAEASHMTPEEFIAFEENIAQMLEERLKDIPDEELKSIFAELYLDENYGRSRESDEVGTGVPEGEGRAESNEGSPGVLSEEWGDNAGASEYSEERPELDDEIEQSGDGILLEADAVDGREEIKFTPPTQIGGENLLDYAARVVESKRVHDAGSEVDTHPTEAQKEAGNYKKDHVKIDGFDITIENPKGSVRSGVDADGRPWSVTMNNTYGYIRGTEGVDGDHIDVFLGDSGNKVYVVDQLNTETEAFDEHKVMYGFNSMDEATEAYLSNYSPGWQGLGAISEVSKESFKKWIDSSHRKTKPFVDYKSVKVENGGETVANLPESNPIASSKKSELGIEIPAMTEEEYIASEGYGFSGIGDVALHKGKQRTSKQQDKIVESQAKKDEDYARHREILRKTYRDKLSKGELREPSTIEKLLKTANGNPDNESTQAARRTLQKRGIDWQENSVRFRETVSSEEQAIIEEVNERFNEELSRYKDGRMKPNEMFHLGTPQGAMLAFLPDSPIVMRQKTIRKGTEKKHNVDVDMLKDMPAMIASPIFVFQRDAKKMGILTEMIDRDGKNVCVAIEMNKTIQDGTNILEVNDIRSFHGREVENIIKPIRDNGTLKWVDKEKGLDWITSALHNFKQAQSDQNLSIEDFSSASKIVESFENPTIEQGKIVSAVENLADSLHTPIRIVKSAEELPEGDVAHKRIENGDGIKGWFDIKSEEMAIYLPNATSVEDARESVFHEVVGHYGLRKLFGEDFNTFLDNVYANVSPEIRKQIVNRAKEQGNILDLREATEEYLAALAERGFDNVEERTLWQKIKDAFIDMLRKAGVHLGFDLTDNELRYVLWRSYQNLESQSIMDRAADIDMQRRLRVGNFRKNEAEHEKSPENYERTLHTVNEFAEKHIGAGSVFVVRSSEKMQEQLEAIGLDKATISNYENQVINEGALACYNQELDKIIIFNANAQIDEINAYLWHESVHRALRNLFGDKNADVIEPIYQWLESRHPEKCKAIREKYNQDSEDVQKEECVVRFFENMFTKHGAEGLKKIIDGAKPDLSDFFGKVYNAIVYGTEESADNRGSSRRMGDGSKERDGLVHTSGKESSQGETEKRFRTGEPTGEERRASGKVDKSTLSLSDSAFRMSKWEKIREAYQDGMISVKLMQDYLAQKTGKAIPEWMDVYLYENSKSGRSGYRMEQFHKKLYAPLMQEAGRLMQEDRNNGSSMEEAERLLDVYMKAKHGLEERNERMRREAMLKKINSIKDEDAKSVALQEMGESGIQDIAFSDESLEKFRVNLLLKDYSGLIGLAGKDENGNDKSMPEVERYAREAISTYEANHDTKKLWELVKDVSEYALKEEYEGGLIDKETYETIRDMYKYYIPLRGRNEKTAEDFFSYIERGASDTGFENVIKKAYGHTYESGNAFAYLAKMAETAIVQSEKNRVKQRLLWMARNYRDPSIMEIANVWYVKDSEGQWVEKVPELAGTEGEQKQAMIEFNQQMEELQKEGKAKRKLGKVDIGVPISTYQAQEHQVRVKENGREYVININADPRIARAINGHSEELNRLVRFIDSSVRYIAAINTSYSLEFGSGNIIRDGEYALGSSFTKEGIRYAAKGAKNTVPAVAAMRRYFRGKQDMSNQMDKYLQEFLENGGETGFTHLSNLNLHERRAKKMLKQASRGKKLRTGENIINQANRFLEMIPRFTTYVTSRESGKSIISSVNDAKNITVNFNRRGSGRMADWETDGLIVAAATSIAPVLSRLQAYSNASIQGVANVFGSAKNHPARFVMTTASVTAIGVLSAIISNMLGGDDEPGYEDIPEWVRHSNFTLFNGKDYFALPLTMEYRPFYTLGESMAMAYLGKSDMKKAAKSIGQSMWDNWNPISPEIFKSGSPTPFLTPIYKNMRDEDFKESKITGRTSWNAYLPEYQRAKKGTGDVFMWVSEGLNDVTGGNKYERGWAQVNPSQLEHLVMGWSGGVGKAVSGLYGIIKNTIAGEKMEPERVPIVRRFYGKVTEENRYRRLKKEFMDKVTEADNLMKSLKRMQKDYENPLDYAERINEIYKDGEYEKAYNLIEDNKTLRDYEAYYNGSETQEEAEDVMKSMIEILEEALKE